MLGEPEAESFAISIANDTKRLASTVSDLEAPIVIEARKAPDSRRELDRVLHRMGAAIVAFNQPNARSHAMGDGGCGKGNHPARLNLADCCSYELLRTADAKNRLTSD